MAVAFRITGELENQESLGLGGEFYPLGQNIRGALGYMFLDMNLEIAKTYENGNPVLYFRDCLALCKDGGELQPLIRQDAVGGRIIKETIYKCNKCGTIIRNPASKDEIMGTLLSETGFTNTFVSDIITNKERTKFKFDVILKESSNESNENLAELMATIKFIEDNGFYVGKRKNKGLGKMSLKNVKLSEIGMKEISQRADIIENRVIKDNGVLTIRLISDTIGKFPVSGNDLLRDIKNTCKFFDPHWEEYRDEWKEPKINLIGRPIELNIKKSVMFLDNKISDDGSDISTPKFNKVDMVVPRGTVFNYQIEGFDKIDSSFWNGLTMTEMLRGLGDRTSFGKGQFVVI